jgi:nicotinic acid mononucleotide adenylyltransferase
MTSIINYNPDNTFIFSFVRMNPPTPGHLSLIKNMIDKAIELGSDKVYIITSSSLDGKNPLPCSSEAIPKPKNKADAAVLLLIQENLIYKSSVLDKMIASYKQKLINSETDETIKSKISSVDVIVICSVGSPFGFIYNLIKHDFIDRGISKINMFFIVGRDRADFLDTIVDNFSQKDYVNSINGMILPREGMETLKNTGMGSRSISEINPSEYSASFIRNLVKNNQKEEFTQVYSDYLSPDEIEKLFQTIKIGTQMKSPPSKEENENPQSRYFDGGLLPIMGPQTTGGKRKSKAFGKSKKNRKTKRRKNKKYTRRNK